MTYEFTSTNMYYTPRGFVLSWVVKYVGFGELSFYKEDAAWKCHSEMMSDEFISQALEAWRKTVEVVG